MRSALSVLVVGLVVLSTVAAAPVAGAATSVDEQTTDRSPNESTADGGDALAQGEDACARYNNGSAPEDPDEDRLGWENGCWYNESIDVVREDGLNETELDAVAARAMARAEEIRELEFERTVPVEVISREQFRESEVAGGNYSTNNTLHQNVKWEAMLMVGEDTDALAVQESNTGSTVGGFYSPTQNRMVVVSDNTTSPQMDEFTLGHEMTHALQDQHFNLSSYDRYTEELNNARGGMIEGGASFVERRYQQRCMDEWECLSPQTDAGGGGGETPSIHYGMYLLNFQPYSDGPNFVRGIYRAEGWEGVNALFENPPASTEQVISPEKYGEDEPTNVSFTDRSGDDWAVPQLENGTVDYAQFGEAGLAVMLFYPFYDSGRTEEPVVPRDSFFNVTPSGLSSTDPINYTTRYTDGWDGDRLYPYIRDDSAETNETGYVWKTVWDSEDDAAEFVEGYTQLLDYYGAEPVDDRANTYRIPDGKYEDAFYVNHTGATVTLVNAPSVEELSEVRAGAAPEDSGGDTETPTDTATATAEPTDQPTTEPGDEETATDDEATDQPTDESTETPLPADGDAGGGDGGDDGTDAPAETTSGGGPGFGLAASLVALALAGLLARRRE